MKRHFIHLLLSICISSACLAGTGQASGPSYILHGVFAPTNRLARSEFVPTMPQELVGKQFTITISWPANAFDYTSDFQYTNDHWGEYGSQLISIGIDVPGFDFSGPPAPSISQWQTLNDTVLDYDLGVPQLSGDELRLFSRATWLQTYTYETNFNEQTQMGSFSGTTDYDLWLRAVDPSGNQFSTDALQTNFDLTSFSSLFFDFQQSVPIQSSDPRPIYFQHWLGIVDSVVAVPEPSFPSILSWAIVGGIICRRGAKRDLHRTA